MLHFQLGSSIMSRKLRQPSVILSEKVRLGWLISWLFLLHASLIGTWRSSALESSLVLQIDGNLDQLADNMPFINYPIVTLAWSWRHSQYKRANECRAIFHVSAGNLSMKATFASISCKLGERKLVVHSAPSCGKNHLVFVTQYMHNIAQYLLRRRRGNHVVSYRVKWSLNFRRACSFFTNLPEEKMQQHAFQITLKRVHRSVNARSREK